MKKNKNVEEIICEGTVEVKSKKNALVRVDKKEQCMNCNKCNFLYGGTTATIIAKNDIDAQSGDSVKFISKSQKMDLWIKIFYFMPLAFLLCGILISLVFEKEIYQLVFALCVFVLGTMFSIIVINILLSLNKAKYQICEITNKYVPESICNSENNNIDESAEIEVENNEVEVENVEENKNEIVSPIGEENGNN